MDLLDNILVENYDLILVKNSLVLRYCKRNDINTLGELIRKYDNDELIYENENSKEEIIGFIDLIKYRHFNIRLEEEDILNYEMIYLKDTCKGTYRHGFCEIKYSNNKYLSPLKRLGFTFQEVDNIKYYLEYKQCNMLIKDIISELNYNNYKWVGSSYKGYRYIFDKKLEILNDYCNKYIDISNRKIYSIKKAEKKLCSLNCLYNEIKMLEKRISEANNEFLVELNKLPSDEEDVKLLVKKYDNIIEKR